MSDAIYEQLSAFLDGELSAAESELLLKRIERDPALKEQLERYVLAGEAMRATHVEARPSRDFSTRVARAIDGESGSLPVRVRQAAGWLKPVAGGAIAAGVAAVALVSFQVAPTVAVKDSSADAASTLAANSERPAPAAQSDPVTGALPIASADVGSASYTVPVASDARMAPPVRVMANGRLANYVVVHSEYSSPLARRNVLTGLVAEEIAGDQAVESFIAEPFAIERWAVEGATEPAPAEQRAAEEMLSRSPR
jgi:sigma-E factor negative regulatory protein RseA